MVKRLSCVSCGNLKRFPHTFTRGGTRGWQSPLIFWQISQHYLNQGGGQIMSPHIFNPSATSAQSFRPLCYN